MFALGRGTPNGLHHAHHPHCRSFQRQVEPGPHGGLPADPSNCRGIQRQLGRPGGHDLLHFPIAVAGQLVVHDHQAVGRADEEVNPPDNSLASVQPRADGVFDAEIAAGPRERDPRKESLERNTEGLCVERKWRSLSGKKVRYGPFVVEDPRVSAGPGHHGVVDRAECFGITAADEDLAAAVVFGLP